MLPESWSDVPAARRRLRWLSWWLESPADAPERIARDALRLPGWAWRAMGSANKTALFEKFRWTEPKPDCGKGVPFSHFDHRGIRYYLPAPDGENMTCIEYPLADEYLQRIYSPDDSGANEEISPLLLLTATLCREHDFKPERMHKRGDVRVPVFGRTDVLQRAQELKGLDPTYQLLALNWFIGMKQLVHKTYRAWIFEEEADEEDDDSPPSPSKGATNQPNFGWWGIFQDVAESGAFGTNVEDVLQAPFHDVCVWLVRQRAKAEALGSGGGAVSSRDEEESDD